MSTARWISTVGRFVLALTLLAACGRTPTQNAPEVYCENGAVPILACGDPCGETHLTVEAAVPNVLLALDRSCSMQARWPDALDALRQVVLARGADVNWGLSVFPDRVLTECEQGDILLPIGARNHEIIPGILVEASDPDDEMYPSGPCNTNMTSGIGQTATDPAFDAVGPQKVVILMTDGWNTCGGQDGAQGGVDLLRKLHDEQGISTYVISFGTGVSPILTDFAEAGGTEREGELAYYIATENLAEIVDEIVVGLRCEYGLSIPDEDVENLEVTFAGTQLVPRDAYSGWTYDPDTRRLSFHGAACDMLRDRGTRVDFAMRQCG